MICTNEQLKPEPKTPAINWEKEVGLCYEAARIMCIRSPELYPYSNLIAEDLKFVLWKCSLPRDDGYGFDPSKGKFTTYAMNSMLRHYPEIFKLHLGINPRSKLDAKVFKVETLGYIEQPSGSTSKRMDMETVVEHIESELDPETAEFFRRLYRSGGVQKEISFQMHGKDRSKLYMQRIRSEVSRLREYLPETADAFEDALEGVLE